MRYKAKLFKNQEILGSGYAEIEDDYLLLRFDEEEIAFLRLKIPEAAFFSRIYLEGIEKRIKNGESHFEIPHYSINVQLISIKDFN